VPKAALIAVDLPRPAAFFLLVSPMAFIPDRVVVVGTRIAGTL
jgi:hypothetical protein